MYNTTGYQAPACYRSGGGNYGSQQTYGQTYNASLQTYSSSYQTSSLDAIVEAPNIHCFQSSDSSHNSSFTSFNYNQNIQNYFPTKQRTEYHAIDGFLKLYRPQTQFINDAQEVESLARETFEKTARKELPQNIIIKILDRDDMKAVHEATGAIWSDNIQGFSINSNARNSARNLQNHDKQIFVKKAELDRVMVVLGHEIGHVLTPTVENAHDEEAKAFAFEIAWVQTMIKHNIGNLKDNLVVDFAPANNGLHDVAAAFVKNLVKKGKEAMELYGEIARRILSIAN